MPDSRGRYVRAAICGLILLAGATRPAVGQTIDGWLKHHKPEEFTGKVWVRLSVVAPKDLVCAVIIDSETNPYGPQRTATGTVWGTGFKPKPWTGDEDWTRPLPWVPPQQDSDWLRAGNRSVWVELPQSKAAQWHTGFFVRRQDGKDAVGARLRLEFASGPQGRDMFHSVIERTDDRGVAAMRMPTSGGRAGLEMVESFGEWAARRAKRVEKLELPPPPHLEHLIMNTWTQLFTYRNMGGNAPLERAAPDFANFEALGVNSLSLAGVADKDFQRLARRHHIRAATLTAWAENYRYMGEEKKKAYAYRDGETPSTRFRRVLDDYYRTLAESYRKNSPFTFSISDHLNLGDEVTASIKAAEISETPQIKADFARWLEAHKIEPAALGAAGYETVQPLDDRSQLKPGAPVEIARRFYFTRRYIDSYTTDFYRQATEAVGRHFPSARIVTVNFQAGPMQMAYIGNSNDLDKGQLDLFELGRRGFRGTMTEDWVRGTDFGVGRVILGAQILRSASRLKKDPTAAYIVGGQAVRARLLGCVMSGVLENSLYLYGPIGNIGPAWSEDPQALREIAQATRELKTFEPQIAAAKPRPAEVALLVATTADIMQVKGIYCCPERQQSFLALAHSGIPVDVVSEQEIAEDDLLKKYRVLYVTDPQMRRDVQQRIGDWVREGGRMVACVGAAQWDEFNQPSAVLDEALGVTGRQMKTQDDWLPFEGAYWATNVSRFKYKQLGQLKGKEGTPLAGASAAVWGARLTCTPRTATAAATYDDGTPAAFVNRYGKGETMLIGCLAGEAYVRAHYPSGNVDKDWNFELGSAERRLVVGALEGWGVRPPVKLSTPGVYTSVMDCPNATLLFLNNASGKPIEKLRVELPQTAGGASVRSVRSARGTKLARHPASTGLALELPLPETEIILIEH